MFRYDADGVRRELTGRELYDRYAVRPKGAMGREVARQHADAIGFRMGVALVGIAQVVIGFPIWIVAVVVSTMLVFLGRCATKFMKAGQGIVTAGLKKIR